MESFSPDPLHNSTMVSGVETKSFRSSIPSDGGRSKCILSPSGRSPAGQNSCVGNVCPIRPAANSSCTVSPGYSGSGGGGNVLNNTTIRLPASGAVVNPTAIFKDLTRGTSFENDPGMQAHLNGFAEAFLSVVKTSQGQTMLGSLEGIGRSIKDQHGFADSVTVMFRLAQTVGSDPMVQFGLFLGLIGVVVAVVTNFGAVGTVSTGLRKIMRQLYITLFSTALDPLVNGTRSAITSFFSENGQFMKRFQNDSKNLR